MTQETEQLRFHDCVRAVEKARKGSLSDRERTELIQEIQHTFDAHSDWAYDDVFSQEFKRLIKANLAPTSEEEKSEAARLLKAIEAIRHASPIYQKAILRGLKQYGRSEDRQVPRTALLDNRLLEEKARFGHALKTLKDQVRERLELLSSIKPASHNPGLSKQADLLRALADVYLSWTGSDGGRVDLSHAKGSRFVSFLLACFTAIAPNGAPTDDALSKAWGRAKACE